MCHGTLSNKNWVCEDCETHLPYAQTACITCAEPLPPSRAGQPCGQCLKQPPAIDRLRTCFDYQYPISQWLPQFKFSRRFALAHWLGRQFIQQLTMGSPDLTNQVFEKDHFQLIPVPLHKRRMRERGYNQAMLVAKVYSQQLQLPINVNCAIRNKRTLAQSGLSLKERQHNIKQAFSLKTEPPKQVILVDDVVTTGSTINELAKTLKAAGTEYVEAWVIAHAPLN